MREIQEEPLTSVSLLHSTFHIHIPFHKELDETTGVLAFYSKREKLSQVWDPQHNLPPEPGGGKSSSRIWPIRYTLNTGQP